MGKHYKKLDLVQNITLHLFLPIWHLTFIVILQLKAGISTINYILDYLYLLVSL